MNSVEIDSSRCSNCGACIDVCPGDVLEKGAEATEVVHPELCITCGHCAAVCPGNVITSHPGNTRTPFTLQDIPDGLPPEHKLFHQRMSTRKYKNQPLAEETIQAIIQYGELAPSSHNFRQREYVVVTDKEKILEMEALVTKVYRPLAKLLNPVVLKLMGLFSKPAAEGLKELSHSFKNLVKKQAEGEHPVFRDAPCVIFIAGPKDYDQARDDCVAAQNYMMLFAQSLGIGSCIMGYAQYPHKKLARFLGIGKDKKLYTVTVLGHPKHKYKKRARFNDPMVTWKKAAG